MSLLHDFIQFRYEKLKLAEDYDQAGSHEMAYVALWSVTEHTVKKVEERRKTLDLKAKIIEWHQYFVNDEEKKRPSPIKNFVCEKQTRSRKPN